MNHLKQQVLNKMKQNQLKITKQREVLIDLLIKHRDTYLDITKIDQLMRQTFPSMSYNTVYRNLKQLEEAGLLEQNNQMGHAMVKVICEFDHHHHFICQNCGIVTELKECPMSIYQSQIPGAEILSHQFVLEGLCQNCSNCKSKEN
ncbi:Fur family transcriptional regulator [Holzapfeliella sp. He02]|uniref:Fur family transcriptional regulator n=1 Tax=Holzapfeliella saturejae TaxID=3082953 RepID=A0ABU8SFW1_9LACO